MERNDSYINDEGTNKEHFRVYEQNNFPLRKHCTKKFSYFSFNDRSVWLLNYVVHR